MPKFAIYDEWNNHSPVFSYKCDGYSEVLIFIFDPTNKEEIAALYIYINIYFVKIIGTQPLNASLISFS
jgi:hypothetical protein